MRGERTSNLTNQGHLTQLRRRDPLSSLLSSTVARSELDEASEGEGEERGDEEKGEEDEVMATV